MSGSSSAARTAQSPGPEIEKQGKARDRKHPTGHQSCSNRPESLPAELSPDIQSRLKTRPLKTCIATEIRLTLAPPIFGPARPCALARRTLAIAKTLSSATASAALVCGLTGATVLGAALPAHAQVGGPIGAPTGMPRGFSAGSQGGGYGANDGYRGGNGLAPPVNNWRSSGFDNSSFGSSTAARNPEPGFSRDAARSAAPGNSGPIDRRYSPTSNNDRPQDPRFDPFSDRERNSKDGPRHGSATRPIVESASATDSIERLRNLVQQGTQHETGMGARKSLSRAFDLYCEAASQGYAEALLRMAWMYAEGNGVQKSRAAAWTLFMRAARFGSDDATGFAKRYASDQEVLPVCLKGTVVERGKVERPATREELAAFAPKLDSRMLGVNSPLSAERRRFTQVVINEAGKYRLDPRLVLAVMSTESGFDANARSPKNAHGLMQLLPETAERFGVRNIDNPVENIRGGMAYIRWLLSYFRGDVALVLAGYNAGEGSVDKHGGVPPFAETLAYVQRIRAMYPFDRHPYDAAATASASRVTPPTATTAPIAEAATAGKVASN